jgi:hypothetical protein
LIFAARRPKRRIGLEERLRRHHAAIRLRNIVLVIVLGGAVIGLSLYLGRASSNYDVLPGVTRSR